MEFRRQFLNSIYDFLPSGHNEHGGLLDTATDDALSIKQGDRRL